MRNLVNDLRDGIIAVYVDKESTCSKRLAKEYLVPHFEGLQIPEGFGTTAEEYISNPDSGPCYIIEEHSYVDGSVKEYWERHGIEVIPIETFAHEIDVKHKNEETTINEDEFMCLLED